MTIRAEASPAVSRPRSPLRYPGGKSRAVDTILALIPADVDTLVSPFLGGGSVELACADMGMRVEASDVFEPLATFWRQLLLDPDRLACEVETLHPLSHDSFYHLQRGFHLIGDPVRRAAVFYALNRSSFSGLTLAGGMSPGHPRFTCRGIDALRSFRSPSLTVDHLDYTEAIRRAPEESVMYCDPPYMNEGKLYGYKGDVNSAFDHEGLARLLRGRRGWILSYNDCPEVRSLYSGYEIHTPSWAYGMPSSKKSHEVLILDLEDRHDR